MREQLWVFGLCCTSTTPATVIAILVADLIYDFCHFTVNHSENFVDLVTNALTQNIESAWKQMKQDTKAGKDSYYRQLGGAFVQLHVAVQIWQRFHASNFPGIIRTH